MTSRWVVADDTDSAITYTGPWFADKGSLDNIGNFGAPYLSTSHGINSTGSFSYIFTGSRVLITGSSEPDTQTSVSWECVVDNGAPSNISVSGSVNNLRLCEQDGLSDASHVLTVNVQATNGATFWLDYVKYLPTASTPGLENAAISIDSTDPDLNFIGWTQFSPGFETSATGSKLSFNFIGKSLLYYGFFDPSLPIDTSGKTASYSIDGQTPVPFDVLLEASALTSNPTGVQYNALLFNTGILSAGPHTLDVTYLGTPETTPLSFEFLVVQNGTSTSAISSGTSASTSASASGVSISATSANSNIETTSSILSPITQSTSTVTVGTGVTSAQSSSSSAALTSTTSRGIPTYQSTPISMLALMGITVYYLCGRGSRLARF
ncbi:hypothetical protein HYPSUDRAFT_39089 [Hypholoma sublateritium FD-334 SS-4]|uniref:Uncharacterized protein n=1 Tax=Hypholoma sublateritium (strain FD-334 SS-4) TaxID=945553 RepID=A0A0D2LAR4_HYPSF|nr:hypothetical protein HYPSUDRAFT_39089 [Hypholoma sublateritium FD-334 SS-4]